MRPTFDVHHPVSAPISPVAQVVLENVTKHFGEVVAVRNVSLSIAERELVVLVGPSGCGKSTTLRMIAGLEEVTSGTIQIGDRVVNNTAPKDRDVAMVFQNYALYPHMTVYKNMAFALKLRRTPKNVIREKVTETAALLGIGDLLERKPRALSGGQQQRVALGRAIVRNPACFLFDEPLSNLDEKLRVETRAEIKRLQEQLQTTAVYVTHDQEEAMMLGHRLAVMHEGEIRQCAPPLEIYRRPANRFVAGFIGSPSMNFFEGTLVGQDGAVWFDEGSCRLRVPAAAASVLGDHVEKPVVMGVRPGAIGCENTGRFAGEGNVLSGRVQVVEPLGESMDVVFSTDSHAGLVARVEADREFAAGATLRLFVDLSRVHFFEPGELGRNLTEFSEHT